MWDAFSTLYFLQRHWATEINPLMAFMYVLGPEYFLAAKAFLVLWGSVILGFAWDKAGARCAAYAMTAIYGVLALYELVAFLSR